MKTKTLSFLLLLLGLLPIVTFAQHYTITLSELNTQGEVDKKSGNKIDMNKAGWETTAKLEFIGLSAGDFEKIEVKQSNDGTKAINANAKIDNNTAVFDLTNAIKNSKAFAFDIYFEGKKKGTVKYDITFVNPKITTATEPENPLKIESDSSIFAGYLGVLTSANFVGNNKFLANLTPIINLGGVTSVISGKVFNWDVDVNPYIGGEIDTKDSVSFMPALMLYGRAGLTLNNYLNFDLGKTKLTLMPFGFGLKFIPNLKDSNNVVIQHNIRIGAAARFSDVIQLSAQITHGWHNLTSESEKNFKKVFGNKATDISYITVVGQFAMKGKKEEISNYIYFEWRCLLSNNRYANFTNNRILTVGIRKTLELTGGGAFSASNKKRTSGMRRIHPNL